MSRIIYFFIIFFVWGCGSSVIIKSTEQGKEVRFGGEGPLVNKGIYLDQRVGNFLGSVDYEISHFYLNPPPRRDIEQFSVQTFFSFKDLLLSLIPFYSSKTLVFQGKFAERD